MARRLGAYAPLSAMYASDDAVIAAGEQAELLFVRGLAFCAGMPEADGYITEAQLLRFVGAGMEDAKHRAQILVREGLWEALDGGYLVRAWLKWNRSSDDLGRERKKDRDRKAAKAAEVRQALTADVHPEGSPDSEQISGRNPDGIHLDSRSDDPGNPSGFQPHAPAREAHAPTGAPGAALHSTPLQNPHTPAASGEGPGTLFGHGDSADEAEPLACPKHEDQLGRRHRNCRACGTSGRVSEEIQDEAEFNTWWATYPNKAAKGAARKAWIGARKKVPAEQLIAAAQAYRSDPRRDPEYTPHPATWLNQERWEDQHEQVNSGGSAGWWDN